MTLLVHHAANRGYNHPAGSLGGLRACLKAGALLVEVDIVPLTDGDFALLHDPQLENATDGTGPVSAATAGQICHLHYTHRGHITNEPVGLLSQAVALVRDHPRLRELQLDLKPYAPLTGAALRGLLRLIKPVRERVRVTSVADWAVRRLHALDAELSLGFDPLLYLDVERDDDETDPPFRVGAYGYRDDHPLASRRWGTPTDYLAARAAALAVQSPDGATWYIRASLLARALDDGFDWIAALHAQEIQVDAWTLDAGWPAQVALARRLISVGVDRITTNDAPRLALALDGAVEF